MAARCLLDTDLLIYTLDRREPVKRWRAKDVLWRAGGATKLLQRRLRST